MNKPLEKDNSFGRFRDLYQTYAPTLIYYAGKYVDAATAEDMVQDTFLKIWQKRSFLFWEENGLKNYLYRSVQHACLDWLKHRSKQGDYIQTVITRLKIEEIYYNDDLRLLFDEDERLSRIYSQVEKLPAKCREIFVMSYLEERKTAEIARLLGISPRTVEAQLYKALKILRSLLLFFIILLQFIRFA